MTQKQHKLDIFNVLSNISSKNTEFYSNLTTDEQKALHPLVVMRWLSGTKDARQVYFLNELVNPFVFSLSDHKELLVDLMAISSPGQNRRYQWTKVKSKKSTSTPQVVSVIKEVFNYSTIQAVEVLPLLTDDNILTYAEHLGRQLDQIKIIKKELKSR